MAKLSRRFAGNAAGAFFVDTTCIDCDTCRVIAPASFAEANGQSYVHSQPATAEERHRALMALVACPVGAIGSSAKAAITPARAAFPERLAGGVHYCGYPSERSYGASSYLIVRPDGNVLVDSPRFTRPLVERIEALGGIRYMFLTHRDDVADHRAYARHFGCARILHEADLVAETRVVEHLVAGEDPVVLSSDLLVVPTPGHTRGSACLLYDEAFLFTGDHLAWDPASAALEAFRAYCWYDWQVQTHSMERLGAFRFTWVLPGHGRRVHLPAARMAAALARCIADMRATP
ncbi:MAG: MBL fold metallo-hydrolase [Alphaproteobacteria bacterium]|nr:MBL fold metallo-hydrolase [Alphaproteobacteria bacterium]